MTFQVPMWSAPFTLNALARLATLEVRQSQPEADAAIRSGSAISGLELPPDVRCAGALLGEGIGRRGGPGADLRQRSRLTTDVRLKLPLEFPLPVLND